MTVEHRHDKPAFTPRTMLGLFIVVVGVIAALDQMNIVSASYVQPFWPIGIIAVGGVLFTQNRIQGGHGVNGAIVMGVGILILLNTLGLARVRVGELIGPAILIFIGVMLIRHRAPGVGRGPAGVDTDGHMVVFAVLSGVKRATSTSTFRGAEVTAFMGGCQLDLRQAVIPPGEEATIELVSVMGGCEIFVPSTWQIVTPIIPVMGGLEDKRLPAIQTVPAGPGTPAAPRLVIRGFLLMSGVQIKN
jgi:predicted membrane protein